MHATKEHLDFVDRLYEHLIKNVVEDLRVYKDSLKESIGEHVFTTDVVTDDTEADKFFRSLAKEAVMRHLKRLCERYETQDVQNQLLEEAKKILNS